MVNHFSQLLKEFPAITNTDFSSKNTKHGVELAIPTTGPPIKARARRLTPDRLTETKKEFDKMMEMGICRRSKSCWSSPLHMIRFTRWPEAIPLAQTDTRTCAQALLSNWIARFGLPEHITYDRGPQFTSQLWTSLTELYGSKLHHTTAYHPPANGLVERFYGT